MYLVVSISNNLPPTKAKLIKGTKTIKEVFGTVGVEDGVVAIISLHWVLTLTS